MDEFENRLKRDADAIQADISPELKGRIDASLQAAKRIQPVPESGAPGINLWWASSVTGLAAAVIVIVLINWNRPVIELVPVEPVARRTVPTAFDELQGLSPPRLIKTADFATPLEEELARLQTDIERARANVKKDIEFTF
jgi:hypothetical protein